MCIRDRTEDKILKQMGKTGNTPFVFANLEVELKGNLFMPVQAQNELRRAGLEALEQAVLDQWRRPAPSGGCGASDAFITPNAPAAPPAPTESTAPAAPTAPAVPTCLLYTSSGICRRNYFPVSAENVDLRGI